MGEERPRARQLTGVLLVAYATLVLLATALAWVKPLGYSFAPWTFHHVLAPALVIASSFSLARLVLKPAVVSSRRRRASSVIAGAAAITATAWSAGASEGATYVDSPADKNMRVVVVEGLAVIDPYWVVSIRRDVGLGVVRDLEVACLDGNDPDNSLEAVVWLSSDSIRITTYGRGSPEVSISSGGRPERVVRLGHNCGGE
jgi:hypothetical protein